MIRYSLVDRTIRLDVWLCDSFGPASSRLGLAGIVLVTHCRLVCGVTTSILFIMDLWLIYRDSGLDNSFWCVTPCEGLGSRVSPVSPVIGAEWLWETRPESEPGAQSGPDSGERRSSESGAGAAIVILWVTACLDMSWHLTDTSETSEHCGSAFCVTCHSHTPHRQNFKVSRLVRPQDGGESQNTDKLGKIFSKGRMFSTQLCSGIFIMSW